MWMGIKLRVICIWTAGRTHPNLENVLTPIPCQHCEDALCQGLPFRSHAYEGRWHRRCGQNKCIGCHYCSVCPYDVPQFDEEKGVSDKCNLCAQRIDKGDEPMCVKCCPARAIHFGDLNDPNSEVAKLIKSRQSKVLLPEQGTHPTTHYLF